MKYAKGKHALGICARSGRKMLLKDLVPDGQRPELLVDPAWRDIKHPAEKPLQDLSDAEALKRPAPDLETEVGGNGEALEGALGFPYHFGGGNS
jgi:hypothetical protein